MAELEEFRALALVEEQNKKMVYLAFDKMWSEGKLDVADEIIAPNHTMHIRGEGYQWDAEAVKKLVSGWLKAFPDLKFEVQDFIADGNKVAVLLHFTGTHQGELWGIAPTGKKIEYSEMLLIRCEKGKCVEEWGVYDALHMYRQRGMELKPKEEK
jgi:predicted ester cyclase